MKKILALILSLSMLLPSVLTLASCGDYYEYDPDWDDDGTEGGSPSQRPSQGTTDDTPEIAVPEYKDYGRPTVNFDEIAYLRPDIDSVAKSFTDLAKSIENGADTYEAHLAAIKALEPSYEEITTMYAYANIRNSKDSSDEFWNAEYKYISTSYPAFSKAVESLFVAAAQSSDALKYESDYFGEGLIDTYSDGGKYTDEVVRLMSEEAELEADYSAFSTENVEITIDGETNTVDYFISYYKNLYGESSSNYDLKRSLCLTLYKNKVNQLSVPMLVELIKIRRLIADELGYDSYAELAYKSLYHDYDTESSIAFIEGIADYIVPLYQRLANDIFYHQSLPDGVNGIHENTVINSLYDLYGKMDSTLSDAFSYMLQYGLYDITAATDNRYSGAFSIYLDKFEAPYTFVTTYGNIYDYTTIAHEFGHFTDSYINYGENTSLDLSEVYSQGLELLTVLSLSDTLGEEKFEYLSAIEIDEMMYTMISQGFYALFEHEAYSLPYNEITEERLLDIVESVAERFALDPDSLGGLSVVTITHIMLYPFYVQSYCTSAAVALEIYFLEEASSGAGLDAYMELIERDEYMTFEEYVVNAGLSSPFDEGYLKSLVNKIHRKFYGTDYYKENSNQNAT